MEKNIRQIIKTSYSISSESFIRLQDAALLCGISTQNLLKIIISRYIRQSHRKLISEDNVISYNSYGKNGYKRIYMRWSALEYSIIKQFKFNTCYSTSFTIENAIKDCLERIVMAIIKLKNKKKNLTRDFFRKIMMKLDRFFVFWPNININSKILPFFQMHLDYSFY